MIVDISKTPRTSPNLILLTSFLLPISVSKALGMTFIMFFTAPAGHHNHTITLQGAAMKVAVRSK